MAKKLVHRKPPLQRIAKFRLDKAQIKALGLKSYALTGRTCWHCKIVYTEVKIAHQCEYWHEGLIDA